MLIGVPREVKAEEDRVAITPNGVTALLAHGHQVLIQSSAGDGSHIADADYRSAGAEMTEEAAAIWDRAELILKVKEPVPEEYGFFRRGQILFTYLHLAANTEVAERLAQAGVEALAYETLQLPDGSLPLLAPMSEIAGRLAVQAGAWCLQAQNGGRGVLLGGASGVRPARTVVLGAGTAGANACQVAAGMGSSVSIFDVNPAKLRYLHDILGGHVTTLMPNRANIEEEVVSADLVIGTVLIPGARTPKLVSRDLIRRMRRGAAIVDVSIDQGGCVETARPTSHHDPIYLEEGVVHYGVTNMPGIVPHTSTLALTNATLQYAMAVADQGLEEALRNDAALRHALNVYRGRITHEGVAEALGAPYEPVEF